MPLPIAAELACVAVHENYRHQYSDMGIGSALLEAAERAASAQKARQSLFALTTQTQEWFVSHGFTPADVESLPSSKQSLYNWQRGSAVLQKPPLILVGIPHGERTAL